MRAHHEEQRGRRNESGCLCLSPHSLTPTPMPYKLLSHTHTHKPILALPFSLYHGDHRKPIKAPPGAPPPLPRILRFFIYWVTFINICSHVSRAATAVPLLSPFTSLSSPFSCLFLSLQTTELFSLSFFFFLSCFVTHNPDEEKGKKKRTERNGTARR